MSAPPELPQAHAPSAILGSLMSAMMRFLSDVFTLLMSLERILQLKLWFKSSDFLEFFSKASQQVVFSLWQLSCAGLRSHDRLAFLLRIACKRSALALVYHGDVR